VPTSPKAKASPPPRIGPVTITGARGDWIADVDGERLAVIHDTHWSGKDAYRDPMTGVDIETKRYTEYVQKLRESDRVVVQRDKGQGSLERDGYVGVFSFKDLTVDPAGPIEMRLTARVANARK
jgi:predicted xylose isomerase-like sugar epimerase